MVPASNSLEILSMETSSRDNSYYRIRAGDKVKYVNVAPGILDANGLLMPLRSLPPLPYSDNKWNVASVSRSGEDNTFETVLESRPLRGVEQTWHPRMVDCLSLERVGRLMMNATSECVLKDQPEPRPIVIAKIARFEWEIPHIERETHTYRRLHQTDLAPQFLGHIHEEGRVIGFLLEKIDGSFTSIEHLSQCEEVLSRPHRTGLLHGGVNRNNFVIGDGWVKLIDFDNSQETQDKSMMTAEMLSLGSELRDESGRGAGFLTEDKEVDL